MTHVALHNYDLIGIQEDPVSKGLEGLGAQGRIYLLSFPDLPLIVIVMPMLTLRNIVLLLPLHPKILANCTGDDYQNEV